MGGYGALRLAFKYPDEFAAVSAQMPALIADLPKNMSSGAPGSPGALMGDVFGSPFNRDYFDRNNVFYFARTDSAASLKRMKIYFNVGNNDDYGFEQGAQELDKLLTSRGIPHEFHIYPGGHDAQFVVRYFGDVMEFQWKAIGAGSEETIRAAFQLVAFNTTRARRIRRKYSRKTRTATNSQHTRWRDKRKHRSAPLHAHGLRDPTKWTTAMVRSSGAAKFRLYPYLFTYRSIDPGKTP